MNNAKENCSDSEWAPIFCSKCGESCCVDGINHVGLQIDISGLPIGVKNKIEGEVFNLCWPCFISNAIGVEVKV